ncbi:MAG: sulfotransferase [Bacteroidetes bacterium]|nr:sulfotransferase [Bacteroidota bacterium]
MILEIIAGFMVSMAGILFFLSLKYNQSIQQWIIETSKFIYYIGHPLWDDDAKYKTLTGHFKKVFGSLSMVILKTLVLLLFVAAMIAIVSVALLMIKGENWPGPDQWISTLFPPYLYKAPFLVGTFLPIILVPFLIRKKENEDQPYSPIEKLFHYVFLGNSNVAKFLFKIELKRNRKVLDSIGATQNVYISGMARAGTTVLMQYLGQISEFASLSYRHMPFLFMPRTWIRMRSKKKIEARERAHKDGIMHSLDSYEALEEPFWRNFDGNDYIRDEFLVSHSIESGLHEKYDAFRKLVSGDKIYLAKNNNHLLRAASLHELDQEAGHNTKTIIPFREPYSQAFSLLNQHKILSKMAEEDEFVKDYMEFLVHHEFGLSHKVPVLDENIPKLELPEDQFSLEYWLEIWYQFYKKAFHQFRGIDDFYFFCYEAFCQQPKASLSQLIEVLGMPKKLVKSIKVKEFAPKRSPHIEPDSKYSHLYTQLMNESININHG